ncbi:MAG: Hsp20/alpha crystallin family protein [Mycobacteriaceae bacterium]|nr:Hsp20/alpha crystallin family protein [Mycobacteriaceae bacterium]
MSLLPMYRHTHGLLPDPSDWFPGFPSTMNLRPLFDTHLIKVEDELADEKYILRAELPGLDSAKDITVIVNGGLLTVKAERTEKRETKGRSEFSYGSFLRTISLPAGADENAIDAQYDNGILTVTVPVAPTKSTEKTIEVTSAN